ncbi:MAG: hypothetical protein HYW78_00135 [Parcubacteria group bacterium]|nr:hypothetical protein [Parcubacteria group bacterium]
MTAIAMTTNKDDNDIAFLAAITGVAIGLLFAVIFVNFGENKKDYYDPHYDRSGGIFPNDFFDASDSDGGDSD